MINNKLITFGYFILFCLFCLFSVQLNAQINVGLDNWYNKEINSKTGKPYHYLWTDTAWSGYSRWGKIFTDNGVRLSTLERPTTASLSDINVYIIVDPDTTTESATPNYIVPEDAKVIEKWVKNGGVLVLMANDGPNCEFTHLNRLAKRFGITFNHVSLHRVEKNKWDMAASTSFSDHPIFKDVKKIYMKEISSLTLSKPAKAILTENGQVFIAESRLGNGMVLAIGDPWIYNEYIDHDRLPQDFENRKAAENLTRYLLGCVSKKAIK